VAQAAASGPPDFVDCRVELITPYPGQAAVARVVERVPVERVRLVRLAGHEGLAALTLAAPSRHWPYSRPFEAAELARSIAATPTLWAALEHLGLLPPGLPDRPLEALDAVVAFERAQAAESVEEVAFDSEEELAAFGCCWLLRICCKSADVVAGGPVALPTPTARR